MKFELTWIMVAIGGLFLGGWGSTSSIQEQKRSMSTTSAPREQRAPERAMACSAESLRWQYDAPSRVLRLDNRRVQLNCCGQHSMAVELVDGIVEVTQRDEPGAEGRCGAQCEYNLSVAVTEMNSTDEAFVRLLRDVTDEGGSPTFLWQGNLDLTEGSGLIALDCSDAG